MHKIVLTGLVAVAALIGSVGPAAAAGAATAAPAAAAPAATAPVFAGARSAATSLRAEAARLGLPALAGLPRAAESITPIGANQISCATPTACLAVGTDIGEEGIVPIAVALEGTAWKTIPVPVPKKGAQDSSLDGVSCKSATYCLVIGDYPSSNGNDYPYVLTWNGSKLAAVPAPPVPHGDSFGSLDSVSCVAVNSCVLFGSAYTTDDESPAQLIWTWNGSKWTLKAPVIPGNEQDFELTAVHCFAVTSCEVAGDYDTTTISGTTTTDTFYLFFATWNGATLALQQAALPPGFNSGSITDLSCVSLGSCAATGLGDTESGVGNAEVDSLWGFLEVWNGTTWTATKWTGPKGTTLSLLSGVSCVSAASCVAVGATVNITGETGTAAAASLVWNGTKWSVTGVPSAGKGLITEFAGVSCPKARACVAIGGYAPAAADSTKPLAGYWNGTGWKLKGA